MQSKQQLREKLQADYQRFIAAGGKPTQCRIGESAEFNDAKLEEIKHQVHQRAAKMRTDIPKKKNKNLDEDGFKYVKPRLKKGEYDLTGKRFGMLVAIARDVNSSGQKAWVCECDCGKRTKPIVTTKLIRELRLSCGCQRGKKRSLSEQAR